MPIVRVPAHVLGSPQDGDPVKFDTETRRFSDRHGNTWSMTALAKCRPGNSIRKWVRTNYPPPRRK